MDALLPSQDKCPLLSRYDSLQYNALTNYKTGRWMESIHQLDAPAIQNQCVLYMVCHHKK